MSQVVGGVESEGSTVVHYCTEQVPHELVDHTPLRVEEGAGATSNGSIEVLQSSCHAPHLKIDDCSSFPGLVMCLVSLEHSRKLLPCLSVMTLSLQQESKVHSC